VSFAASAAARRDAPAKLQDLIQQQSLWIVLQHCDISQPLDGL